MVLLKLVPAFWTGKAAFRTHLGGQSKQFNLKTPDHELPGSPTPCIISCSSLPASLLPTRAASKLRALQGPGVGGSEFKTKHSGWYFWDRTGSRGADLLGRNPIRIQVLKFSTDPKEKLEKVTRRQLGIVGNTTLHPHYQSQAPKVLQELRSQDGPAWEGLLSEEHSV